MANDNISPMPTQLAWRLSLFLLVLTLVAYLPALRCTYIWDDDDYVTENATLPTVDGLRRIWLEPGAVPQYYPLVHTSFWIEYRIWKLHPFGFHLVNVLLHAITAMFLWRLLRRLSVPGAWLIAAIFAVHPVTVESVAWVTERKNVLCAVFYFASLLVYWRFATGAEQRGRGRLYALALGLFVAGLLSKTVACSMPAVVLVLMWWRHPEKLRRQAVLLLPFFIVGLGMAVMTVWMERHVVGAVGAEFDLSMVDRCGIAGRALWFYAGKVLLPYPLIFVYPRWTTDPLPVSAIFSAIAAVAVLVGLFCGCRRWGRGPLAGALIFAGVLLPALGFIDVYPMRYAFVADHFQYLAMPAMIAMIVVALISILQRYGVGAVVNADSTRRIRLICALVLLVLVAATWNRCLAFYDAETLWRDTLKKNDSAWIAHNNLGKVLLDRGEPVSAIDHFKRVVELKPDHGNGWNNLGLAYTRLGQYEAAELALDEARMLRPRDETILVNYATLLVRQERFDEAGDIYLQVIDYYPDSLPAYMNLGNMLAGLQKHGAAERVYAKARELQPDNPVLLYNLGNLARDREDLTLALEYYQGAVTVAPDYIDALSNIDILRRRQAVALAHNDAGENLAQLGQHEAALAAYAESLQHWATYPSAQLNTVDSQAALGRYAEAVTMCRQLLMLDAGAVPAQRRLAWILATAPDENVRRPKEAVALASAAVSATAGEVPELLDILAAAQAASGNFREALDQVGTAIELAVAQERNDLLAALGKRRDLYEQGRPYLEPKH